MIETISRDNRRFHIAGEKTMSHFPFQGSPSNQNTISSTPPSPPVSIAMAVTSTIQQGARSASPCSAASGPPNSNTSNSNRCCDSGRPLFTDPQTGQTVCSCQHEQMLNYQRLAQASLIGHGGMQLSMYNSGAYPDGIPTAAAAAAAAASGYLPGVAGAGGEQAHFYTNLAGLDLKDNMPGGAPWPYGYPYPYDPAMTPYGFNGYGMELNGARRKNATRETTSVLKAWLNEHKKNPYPTKGEKIMLAIITKMTLTQVSTWFANARRRLKKENKMTWEPKNRVDDDDANIVDDDDDDDNKSNDGKDLLDSKDSGTASSEDGDHQHHHHLSNHHPHHQLHNITHHHQHNHHKSNNRLNESHPGSGSASPDIIDKSGGGNINSGGNNIIGGGYPLYHPAGIHHYRPPIGTSIEIKHTPGGSSTNSHLNNKPRIWSLADMASKEDKESSDNNKNLPIGIYQTGSGKIVSPLASRMPYSPYIKHELTKPEVYRNFNVPHGTPTHLTVGHPDYALLESYQRALVAHNNGLAAASMHSGLTSMMSKTLTDPSVFAPLSLTTINNHSTHSNHMNNNNISSNNNINSNNNNNNNSNSNNNNSTSVPSSGASPSASSTSSRHDNASTPLSQHHSQQHHPHHQHGPPPPPPPPLPTHHPLPLTSTHQTQSLSLMHDSKPSDLSGHQTHSNTSTSSSSSSSAATTAIIAGQQ